MAASKVLNCINTIVVLCFIVVFMGDRSDALNLGLFAGDNKRHSNPLFIKKVSRLSPVFININSGAPRLPIPNLSLPKVPPKPLKLGPKLPKLKNPLKRSLLPLSLPPILLPPILPKLPILPIIPPLLPLLPPLPILPFPLLPPIRLPKLPKPIKVPILGKTPLQKALGSELKPVSVPPLNAISLIRNKQLLDKLLELKKKGSLTTAEFIRFRRLLLQK